MKFMMIAAAALCVAFAGCKKEETPEAKPAEAAAKAAEAAKPAADAAKKAAEAPKPADAAKPAEKK